MNKDEALQVIRSNFPTGRNQLCEALETLIPEFKKSDDETIRKALKSFFDSEISDYGNVEWRNGIRYGEIVSWLEKQGEQKSTWSEEDEEMTKCVLISLEFFENLGKDVIGHPHPNYFKVKHKIYPDSVRNWLKSLKRKDKNK